MKTLLLTAASLIILSFSSNADDQKPAAKANRPAITVPVAPMVAGSPDEQAPEALKSLLANPSAVPSAPMAFGNADEAPAELSKIAAYPVQVPVAPMAIGSPDEEAPLELSGMPAYAAN